MTSERSLLSSSPRFVREHFFPSQACLGLNPRDWRSAEGPTAYPCGLFEQSEAHGPGTSTPRRVVRGPSSPDSVTPVGGGHAAASWVSHSRSHVPQYHSASSSTNL